jgi:hypothetical protein
VKDQPSTSDNSDDEPVRFSVPQPPIEEYLVWSPEHNGYIAPGVGSHWDAEAWMREFCEELANRSEEERSKGTISVDQLRAAGALDVPPAWRKSLSNDEDERDLFSDLLDDDDNPPQKEQPS